MSLDGTYQGLLGAIGDWLVRPDLGAVPAGASTAPVADFVALYETKIWDTLRLPAIEVFAPGTIPVDGNGNPLQQLPLPSDWLEGIWFYLSASPVVPLEYRPPELLVQSQDFVMSGQPKYFSIVGGQIIFNRIPDSAYAYQLAYYKKVKNLASAPSNTNEIFLRYQNLYLFGALLESPGYLGEDARRETWKDYYGEALENAKAAGQRAVASGSTPYVKAWGLPPGQMNP